MIEIEMVREAETWWESCFDIVVRFEGGGRCPGTEYLRGAFLRILGATGLWSQPADIGHQDRCIPAWKYDTCCYCLCRLGELGPAAVFVWPEEKQDALTIQVPRAEMARFVQSFPSVGDPPRDRDTLATIVVFHRKLIRFVREIHRTVRLEAVMLKEDTWRGWLKPSYVGILIAREVAQAGGFEGVARDAFVEIPLHV